MTSATSRWHGSALAVLRRLTGFRLPRRGCGLPPLGSEWLRAYARESAKHRRDY